MKTNILSSMNSVKNSFAKRVLMVIAVVMAASSAWGMSTSDIENSAATTITDGAGYVIATAYNGYYLTTGVIGDWGLVSNSINDAAIFVAHGNASGFYLTCSAGTLVVPASNFAAYDDGSTNNLLLGGSGEIRSINYASNSINLRSNTDSKFRWYNGTTGNAVYLYKVTTKYTVTYNAGAGTCKTSDTESTAGGGITLATATPSDACAAEGWAFAGWKQTSALTNTTTIPTLIPAGTLYHPHSNETLYAVYKQGNIYAIDFESAANTYTNWTFTALSSQGYNAGVSAHGGTKIGLTSNGSGAYSSLTTTSAIASPQKLRFYISKTSTNNTASSWCVYTSSDGSTWGDAISTTDAKSMTKGTWVEVIVDLSSYSNVYVKIEYGTVNSPRAIDDVVLSCATYNSNPSCCATSVALSAGTETNATISSFSPSSVTTCGTGENDRKVTITVAAATGYEFTSSARLTYSGDGTATYVSGPTGTGPYTFVYQFAKDDDGSGSFSVTSATPKTYSITYKDQGGGDFSGTQTSAPTTHTYGTATTLKIPTKFGHTFGGWYTASDCASGAVGDASSASLAADGYTDDITLYAKWTEKAVTNYRTSCCDYKVTFTQNNPENGTIAFSHSSLTTCGATDGERQRTMTITPDPGYKLKTFEVADGDGKVAASNTSPAVAVDEDNSDAQVITLTFAQNAEGNYDVTATFEEMHDEYYDYMHANAKQGANRTGVYNAPSLSSKTATTGADCKENHYKFKGWVAENEINENGTLKGGYTLISGGTSMTASNKKYYAVWAEEE